MEWKGNRLAFRTSLNDEQFGRAIAVAGLYELEELIAEIHEENPILETVDGTDFSSKENNSIELKDNKKNSVDSESRKTDRKLIIELSISGKQGLKATPFGEQTMDKKIQFMIHKKQFGRKISTALA